MMKVNNINFPEYQGIRCLMMPFIQGYPESIPDEYQSYNTIISETYFKKGDIGYLTIDESFVSKDRPQRGDRAKTNRAIHTEAGIHPDKVYAWGGGGWGSSHRVTLDKNVGILLANNIDDSCALWNAWHNDTSIDGDIGHYSDDYPYTDSILMKSGEVHKIGILTPHESLPVKSNTNRQFLRIVSSGVHGTEPHFTSNPLL